MLSRISLRLSDVLSRDARNCNIAKDPERGVGPAGPAACAPRVGALLISTPR